MSIRLAGLVVSGFMAVLMALFAVGCEAPAVGDPCEPSVVPTGGFQRTEVYLESPSLQCRTRVCIVNHYRGDLILDPREGDMIGEEVEPCGETCGWANIEDRIYCTCKCGVTAGGDPQTITCDECPDTYECCPVFSIGGEGFKGDYCVRKGTCEQAAE